MPLLVADSTEPKAARPAKPPADFASGGAVRLQPQPKQRTAGKKKANPV